MEVKTNPGSIWNDHWNNRMRFSVIMEPYITICFAIKYGDIGLLGYAL